MLLEDAELTKLIVETHSTVAMLTERTRGMDNKLAGLIIRVDKTNGSVADIQAEAYKQAGAFSMFKWLFAATLTVMSVGAGIAGIVLAIVSRGG